MKWKLAFVALCVALLAPGVSSAATLDFGAIAKGGMIVVNGSNVAGTGIVIDTLLVDGTSADGTYAVNDGVLSFDTAADTFTIVGSVPGLGVGLMPLLTGTIAPGWTLTVDLGIIASFHAVGPDTKAQELLSALNIAPSTVFNFVGTTMGSLETCPAGVAGKCYGVTSTDFINTSGVGENGVPEPGTLMLLGGGLLGLVRARRRVA